MIFRIKRTAVEINFRFAAVLTFLLLFFPDGNAVVCFLLCLLHESGHLLMLIAFRCSPEELCLDFFGMKITTDKKLISFSKEIAVAAAGPLVNFSAALILYAFHFNSEAAISMELAIFNLLPVPMLDGGRILSCFVSEKVLNIIGKSVALIILIIGIAVAVHTRKNFTILAVAIYILIGIKS